MTSADRFRMPPGPKAPALIQGLMLLVSWSATLRRAHRRHGDAVTLRLLGIGTAVVISDPDLIKQTFTAKPHVLHAGERNPLRPVLGEGSVFAMDEGRHLRERKLLLPPLHGERMQSYEQIFEQETLREIASWPEGEPFRTLEPMNRITLNAIIRAVFGAGGAEFDDLRKLFPPFVELGSRLSSLPFLQRNLGRWSPWGRFLAYRREYDEQVGALIAAARRDPALPERSDILALLVQATYEDGTAMTDGDIADELLTLLAAGHETTAGTLAWAVERLRRHPQVLRRLSEEVATGGSEYRDATIREIQRVRPVIGATMRTVVEPFELGPWRLPPDTAIVIDGVAVQADDRFFPRAASFEPERFVGRRPETYSWVPFGGGVRRCVGASFAHVEMDVVLRTLVDRLDFVPSTDRDERWKFRGVAFAPARGGQAVMRRRPRPLSEDRAAKPEGEAAVCPVAHTPAGATA